MQASAIDITKPHGEGRGHQGKSGRTRTNFRPMQDREGGGFVQRYDRN
jgi:hypothetical protein